RSAILSIESIYITYPTRIENKEELQNQILRQVEKLIGEITEARLTAKKK
ncbi:27457_t:CDS:1, partial [Dentiscutata erythropus]